MAETLLSNTHHQTPFVVVGEGRDRSQMTGLDHDKVHPVAVALIVASARIPAVARAAEELRRTEDGQIPVLKLSNKVLR